ncbi:NADPH-dependent FMN reductase [Thiorhodospira sibirica]|uniref:NADPH-dependent FMN reductase n=1 Tax=Thiorhodospira sibirica TaxID=154347 RepID=UPI00022C1CFC|nr:NAD(P)H-dependent oxidoreductase [Thiorhodospira sibirica]
MSTPRLLALCGSTRKASLNRKLLLVMAEGARTLGAEVELIELGDYSLPVYDEELEQQQGLPANVTRLHSLFAEHDGLLLTCPEYNGFFTPLLKNTFDWISRPLADGSGRFGGVHLHGKPAGVGTASPGGLGGIRALQHTRHYLANLGFIVVPEQMSLGNATRAFDAAGQLTDENQRRSAHSVGTAVARLAQALRQ